MWYLTFENGKKIPISEEGVFRAASAYLRKPFDVIASGKFETPVGIFQYEEETK